MTEAQAVRRTGLGKVQAEKDAQPQATPCPGAGGPHQTAGLRVGMWTLLRGLMCVNGWSWLVLGWWLSCFVSQGPLGEEGH